MDSGVMSRGVKGVFFLVSVARPTVLIRVVCLVMGGCDSVVSFEARSRRLQERMTRRSHRFSLHGWENRDRTEYEISVTQISTARLGMRERHTKRKGGLAFQMRCMTVLPRTRDRKIFVNLAPISRWWACRVSTGSRIVLPSLDYSPRSPPELYPWGESEA